MTGTQQIIAIIILAILFTLGQSTTFMRFAGRSLGKLVGRFRK